MKPPDPVLFPYLHLTTTWIFLPFSSRLIPLGLCEAMAAEGDQTGNKVTHVRKHTTRQQTAKVAC